MATHQTEINAETLRIMFQAIRLLSLAARLSEEELARHGLRKADLLACAETIIRRLTDLSKHRGAQP